MSEESSGDAELLPGVSATAHHRSLCIVCLGADIEIALCREAAVRALECDVGVDVWRCWGRAQLEAAVHCSHRERQVPCDHARPECR